MQHTMLSLFGVTAALPPPPPISHHAGQCIDGGDKTNITVHFAPTFAGYRTFTWGPLPNAGDSIYAFALDRALALLAPACVEQHGLTPNTGNGGSSERNLWLGRVDEPDFPADLDLGKCGCGAALFACGSGGCTGDNLRQMRALAAQGFTVIAPDSMASPSPTYPRGRPSVASVSQSANQNECIVNQTGKVCGDSYWCGNMLYLGGCPSASDGSVDPSKARPGCFSSHPAHILYDPAGWAAFYERVCATAITKACS